MRLIAICNTNFRPLRTRIQVITLHQLVIHLAPLALQASTKAAAVRPGVSFVLSAITNLRQGLRHASFALQASTKNPPLKPAVRVARLGNI